MTDEELAKQEFSQKNVAFYTTFLNAWVENRMETDKQLLTLSSLAIGLLMTYSNELHGTADFVCWLIAGLLFIFTIISVLCIFRTNSKYIECLLTGEDSLTKQKAEHSLQTTTACAFAMFILGVIFTFIFAIVKSGFILTKVTAGAV